MNSKLCILPLALTAATGCNTAQKSAVKTPNVVFIYADDIGYGDLSCNGAKTISTPNVERLAQSGIRFTNAHSAAATSTPSRYALLTGEYAWRRQGTGIAAGNAATIINPDSYTMADLFNDAGYTTAVVGKWHLGLGAKTGEQDWNSHIIPGTNELGFDYSFIMAATGDRVPCVYVENDSVVGLDPNDPIEISYTENFPGEPTGKDNPEMLWMHPSHRHDQTVVNGISRIGYMKGGHAARWKDDLIGPTLTSKAVEFIENHSDEPFFLYFATQDAHVPRVPSKEFAGKSGMGPRGDCLLQFDWSVGQILDVLERLSLMDNTLIILSSDNGPVVDDGYKDRAVELLGDHKPSGIYRGGKYSLYEAGTRVPCIWSWKGEIEPGTTSDALLCQVDWFATFAEILGRTLPEGAAPDSEAMAAAWKGHKESGREWLVLQNIDNNLSITDGRWKYLRPGKGPAHNDETDIELGNSRQPQLFDLQSDPSEQTNLAGTEPGQVERLAAQLERIVDNRYCLKNE